MILRKRTIIKADTGPNQVKAESQDQKRYLLHRLFHLYKAYQNSRIIKTPSKRVQQDYCHVKREI
jgi:hypothetical protein